MFTNKTNIKKLSDYLWEIPKDFRADMRVPARIYADSQMLEQIMLDRSLEQLVNVAALPGIQRHALAMPDAHEGYGFPIGGVAAIKWPDGIISPGGIGYDINCGVRLLLSSLVYPDIKPRLEKLADELFHAIPSGVGRGGKIKLDDKKLDEVLSQGVRWAVKEGYGGKEDMERIESGGSLENTNPAAVSPHAKNRGRSQLGTLGAGNHFIEIDRIEEIFEADYAKFFGLNKDQIVMLIHTGSRGLGHQVATDYIRKMSAAMPRYNFSVLDRELAGVPFSSPEGIDYFDAMTAAANFAWVNRQLITWKVRKVFAKMFGKSGKFSILYDLAHNIAKIEEHEVEGEKIKVILHRKGATRAFGPEHPELPKIYQKSGQPVIIPGSMGTASYVLVGTARAMSESFGSSCHGAGRVMSRHAANRNFPAGKLLEMLKKQGIIVRAGSRRGLAEEAPGAYKNIHNVVDIVGKAGIAIKVAKLRPLVAIKG